MAFININRSIVDQFNRYKMPVLLTKVKGKGNGVKTIMVNMTDVAKALDRHPMYILKYFSYMLGAQVYFDQRNKSYLINGLHSLSKIHEHLENFIKQYVLCLMCNNPETVLNVSSKGLTSFCKACGFNNRLPNNNKLTVFIYKNPPKGSSRKIL